MTLREENLADIVLEEFEIRRTDLESKDEIELEDLLQSWMDIRKYLVRSQVWIQMLGCKFKNEICIGSS